MGTPDLRKQLRVGPGKKFSLAGVDPDSEPGKPDGDKDGLAAADAELDLRFAGLQERLWAERERSVLVVLQGMDASGKDGVIKHVFGAVNPLGVVVSAFKAPTEDELAHDFLWRVHARTPGKGQIGIFNRSHYEDVLIVRVHGWVSEKVWRKRYDTINAFESGLAAAGTTVVKIWLHISADEQKRRFVERLEDPTKRWKFRAGDLDERKLWPAYMEAADEMLERTSTDDAPWYVVPADHKRYRDWAVSSIIVETLEGIGPKYPDVELTVKPEDIV